MNYPNKPLYLLIFLVLIFSACKSSRLASKTTPVRPAPELPRDTVSLAELNQKDSLKELQALNMDRLPRFKNRVSLIGVGDIMMGTNFPSEEYLPYKDGEWILEDVAPVLQKADVTFGNHEGVILNEGGEQKHCSNPKLCYLFRTPERYVKYLEEAGFDVMSLANNHAGDFGQTGRASTMNALEKADIEHAGQETHPFNLFEMDGMRYGFAAFSPNVGTVSINDHKRAKEIIAHLDSVADIVIVSFHGGAEGSKHEHVTREREYFYGENRGNVYRFSHELIDAGADVIFGHGPHVTRAMELYNNRFIIYSLGNFCTYGRFNLRGVNGIAPIIKIYTNARGEFLEGEIIPTYQPGAGGPKIDPQGKVITKLQQLTQEDFPETNLQILDDGKIIKKAESARGE